MTARPANIAARVGQSELSWVKATNAPRKKRTLGEWHELSIMFEDGLVIYSRPHQEDVGQAVKYGEQFESEARGLAILHKGGLALLIIRDTDRRFEG